MRFLFLILAILMVLAWLGAVVAFHVAGAAVHLLLLVGLVLFLIHFMREYRG
jgi:hypothetical protein